MSEDKESSASEDEEKEIQLTQCGCKLFFNNAKGTTKCKKNGIINNGMKRNRNVVCQKMIDIS